LPAHLSGSRVRKASDIACCNTLPVPPAIQGVTLTHANLLANIRAIGEAVQLTRKMLASVGCLSITTWD